MWRFLLPEAMLAQQPSDLHVKLCARKAESMLLNSMSFRGSKKAFPITSVPRHDLQPSVHVLHRVTKSACVGKVAPYPSKVIFNKADPCVVLIDNALARWFANAAQAPQIARKRERRRRSVGDGILNRNKTSSSDMVSSWLHPKRRL